MRSRIFTRSLGSREEGGRADRPSGHLLEEGRGAEDTQAGGDGFEGRESLTASGSEAGELRRPNLLGPVLSPINPARLHRRMDELLGLDDGDRSSRPEAPEIPEPVFFELVRPLGALKYESEVNYLYGAFTGGVPDLQVLELEYVFADWNAAKLELTYTDGNLETIEPGYQRTFGVGRRHNWVHGCQIFPEIFTQKPFVGGTAVYMFAWKPEERSAWSTMLMLGASRGLIEEPKALAGPGQMLPGRPAARRVASGLGGSSEPLEDVWRPVVVADFWYTLSPSLAVGMEDDFFPSARFGEYLILPHVNWQPTAHVFSSSGQAITGWGPTARRWSCST